MLKINEQLWKEMLDHSLKEYPSEACGILAGPKDSDEASQWHVCQNIYDQMHAKDPETYPRTSKTAYLMDGAEQKKIFEDIEESGLVVKSIVHSHTDHDAYFSDEDKLVAAPWGEPFYPEITYVVISIWDQKFKEANEFYWDASVSDFAKHSLK